MVKTAMQAAMEFVERAKAADALTDDRRRAREAFMAEMFPQRTTAWSAGSKEIVMSEEEWLDFEVARRAGGCVVIEEEV